MTNEMYASGDKGKQEESSKIELASDFNAITYDGPFKKDCTLSDIIGLIESVAPGADTGQNYGSDKITISESYVNGEGTVKFDLLVKAGCKYRQIAGQFKDSRLKKHDIEFKVVADKYGEELEDMAKYYSEVEEIVAEEAEEYYKMFSK